ncbi:EAL domain-containing protein [Paenibacillus filicis]|uniref:EAL domain-containing protein n=1 Tax=Paenibacillus gyeongsangnamensis TaxID=3388067 RepID=A0ABT4QIB5_9BACL|nr:EAL domain-containing protein [Paenibacillus filicis]MCZ8516617.1 EAL domain-containing protein [Paenibacillus filicis]
MLASCSEAILTARLGGDEFVVVLLGVTKELAELFAQDLQYKLSSSIYLSKLNITFSIGISSFPEDSRTIAEILQHSDIAMYRAKRDGKNRIRAFSSEIKSEFLDVLQIEHDLRKAWDKNEFHLVYQPQVSVISGKIIAVEALLRWHHTERGFVPPDTFIPILERTGLGQWVLLEASRMCRYWQQVAFPELRIAVNVSPIQLQDPSYVSFRLRGLAYHKSVCRIIGIRNN